MPKVLLATKGTMSRTFRQDGIVVPTTTLKVGDVVVTQVKTVEKDGYRAIQLGSGKVRKVNKAKAGHLKASGKLVRNLREFKVTEGEYTVGQSFDVSQFAPGDLVTITGWSKGRGFQGVVRRHGFHGHPSSHGHKDQLRMPGSIGAGGVQHVTKGRRMAGHMGDARISVHNLEVIEVKPESGEILIKGAVPGALNSLVLVKGQK